MPTPDQIIKLRAIQGVNLIEDARITDQGSWEKTQNLYGRNPGALAKRPGSSLVLRGASGKIAAPSGKNTGPKEPYLDNGRLGPGETLTGLSGNHLAGAENILDGGTDLLGNAGPTALKGVYGIRPMVAHNSPMRGYLPINPDHVNLDPVRVAGLFRLYFDKGDKRYWVGAYNMGAGLADQMFFINSDNEAHLLNIHPEVMKSIGGEYHFVPFRFKGPTADEGDDYYAIVTNGIDMPMVLKDGSYNVTNDYVNVAALNVVPAHSSVASGDPGDSVERLFGAQAIAVYNGAVVYGGYKMFNRDTYNTRIAAGDSVVTASAKATTPYDNFITFSIVGEPHRLVESEGTVSSIRIGDTAAEPITAMTINSIASDAQGVKGQLVIFTSSRVAIFDGVPPTSGNPGGVNFHSVAMKDIGCNAPRTVTRTPYGIVFLGTDGIIYLIPPYSSSGPMPIGRAIEPLFRHLTPRQQRFCASVFDNGWYKISYPPVNQAYNIAAGGSSSPGHQYWADLRYLGGDAFDQGARWYGPMVGMYHSCYAEAQGAQDAGEIYAGGSRNGDVYQIGREDLATDPTINETLTTWTTLTAYTVGAFVKPVSNTYQYRYQRWECVTAGVTAGPEPTWTTTPVVNVTRITDGTVVWIYRGLRTVASIEVEAVTGLFDLGDAHIDKTLSALSFGVNTNRATTVETNIIVYGDASGSINGETFTESVAPAGPVWGTFVWGTAKWGSPNSFTLVTERPTSRLRGKTFRFKLRETANARALMHFSDLSFRAIIATRRI